MSRRPSFRRDAELQAELRRINKLVQNKQSRIRKGKSLEVVGVDTVKPTEFESRRDIDRYLKKMSKFLEKKANFTVQNNQGAEIRYSEVQEIEKVIRRVNKQKKQQWDKVKDLPYQHRGVNTGLTVADQANPTVGMGDPKFADFKPLKFNPNRFRSAKEFRDYARDKEKLYGKDWLEKQNELYRNNYIKSMENNLGSPSKELQDHIKNMPLDDFIKQYYTENNAHINFVYDRLAVQARVNELERVWKL